MICVRMMRNSCDSCLFAIYPCRHMGIFILTSVPFLADTSRLQTSMCHMKLKICDRNFSCVSSADVSYSTEYNREARGIRGYDSWNKRSGNLVDE